MEKKVGCKVQCYPLNIESYRNFLIRQEQLEKLLKVLPADYLGSILVLLLQKTALKVCVEGSPRSDTLCPRNRQLQP